MRALSLGLFALFTASVAAAGYAQRSPLQAGQWEMTATIKMAGVPGGQGFNNKPRTIRYCVSPQSSIEDTRNLLVSKGCSIKRFTMANGKVDVESACGPTGHTMMSKTMGTYTPTSFHTASRSTMSGPMAMSMESDTKGHWVGACPAKH